MSQVIKPEEMGTKYHYFLYGEDDTPARHLSATRFPELLRGGKWVVLYDLWAWMHGAMPTNEAEWRKRVIEKGGDPDAED